METSEHIAALQRDGELLAAAAERAGLDAKIPSCPSWQVKDLLRHISYVHRWAAGYVVEQRKERLRGRPHESEILQGGPPDGELVDWFRAGHAALVAALSMADPAMTCWTFLDAPSPLAFWARRQAHETAIHRVDAELASGDPIPFPAEFASDGIDELIMGFFGRDAEDLSAEQQAGGRQALLVQATDTGASWVLDLTADGKLAATVRRGGGLAPSGPAQCTLAGPAPGLYLLLWNRAEASAAGVQVSGDSAVLETWQNGMRVTWQ
ncbi:MAG TPA: maleylpyruvate isomerase family mycothiol-dependent enzyme [Streptosporangiaceae bacterium]|nr:maleylpyruvate isomerase family mycothiol-dependent enzyme [Streptosporangiaceae bacterium]